MVLVFVGMRLYVLKSDFVFEIGDWTWRYIDYLEPVDGLNEPDSLRACLFKFLDNWVLFLDCSVILISWSSKCTFSWILLSISGNADIPLLTRDWFFGLNIPENWLSWEASKDLMTFYFLFIMDWKYYGDGYVCSDSCC